MPAPTTSVTQPALLFVPDISGFTQFVQATEIAHSRHIIEELLEKLIEANDIGLQVSEIEGDAILFYRFGPPQTAEAFFQQVQKMFVAFHSHLRLYETQRICRCGACMSAQNLTLKIVAHFGHITQSHIKEHVKLFGQDVIKEKTNQFVSCLDRESEALLRKIVRHPTNVNDRQVLSRCSRARLSSRRIMNFSFPAS